MNEKEEGEALVPPKTKNDSNDVSNTPIKIGFAQYVQDRAKQYYWYSKSNNITPTTIYNIKCIVVKNLSWRNGKNNLKCYGVGFFEHETYIQLLKDRLETS